MSTLYLLEQGSTLRFQGGRFEVVDGDGAARTLPAADIERVACFGRVGWTTPALAELLRRGVSLSLHTQGGHCRGLVHPEAPPAGLLRAAQWRAVLDEDATLAWARPLVEAKARAAAAQLRAWRRGGTSTRAALGKLRALGRRAFAAPSLDALLGHEGAISRAYFAELRRLAPEGWGFRKRECHPAPDPFNALLSFTYGLAGNQINAELTAVGLDLAAGFLHRPKDGRASLGLDLLEPFRYLVCDHFVLRQAGLGSMKPGDFAPHEAGGVRMTPEARARIIKAWDAFSRESHGWMGQRTPNAAFREEAQRLASALRENAAWRPLPWCP